MKEIKAVNIGQSSKESNKNEVNHNNKIDTVLFYFKVIFYTNTKQKNHFTNVNFSTIFSFFFFKNQRILYYFLLFLLFDEGLGAIVGVGPNKLL